MGKAKKAILITAAALGAVVIGIAIWVLALIYELPLDNYQPCTHAMVIDGQDIDAMHAEGYTIKFPWFEDNANFGVRVDEDWHVYNALIDPLQCYAYDVTTTFQNCAKLDYTVTIDDKAETLTVAFTGWGYPDGGKGEPLCLDRVFVFDVSGVQQRKTPLLIKDEPADPDAVYEFMLKLMRGEYIYTDDRDIIDAATGESVRPQHR